MNQSLTFNVSIVTANGPISFTSAPAINSTNGDLTFTTAPNSNGTVVVRVTLSDNGLVTPPNANTSPAHSFTISVTPVNDPPFVANPIADFHVSEDAANTSLELFPQVFNDPDISTNSDSLTFVVTGNSNPQLVTSTLAGTRLNLAYGANLSGEVRITVQARDRNGASVEDIFTVTVDPVNDPPVVQNDFAVTPKNQPLTLNVLSNDSDSDGTINANSLVIVSSPSRGFAVVNANGTITFTPATNFLGESSFRYTVQDNLGATSTEATVTIKVNEPPVARDDSGSTRQGTATTINVLANDSDSDGQIDPQTVVITVQPTKGTVAVNGQTGAVTYNPLTGSTGSDTFRYRVRDDNGVLSNEATVSVLVARSFDWQNPNNRLDVNADGIVSPIDALLIVNYLNANDSGPLPVPTPGFSPPPYLDPSGDGFIAPNDALDVINQINASGGEGEANALTDAGFGALFVMPEFSQMRVPDVRSLQPEMATVGATRSDLLASSNASNNLLVGNSVNNYRGNLRRSTGISGSMQLDSLEAILSDLIEASEEVDREDSTDSALRDLFG